MTVTRGMGMIAIGMIVAGTIGMIMTATIATTGIGHPTVRHTALGTIIIVRVTVGNPITITTIATDNRLFSKPSCLVQIQLGGFFIDEKPHPLTPPRRGGETNYPLLSWGSGRGMDFIFFDTILQ